MPRKNREDRIAREQEALNSLVRTDGKGEDPVVRDALSSQFTEGSNQQAAEIAIALRELLSGQKAQSEEIAKIRARMDAIDKASEKWENDRQRFLDDINAQADKIRGNQVTQDRAKAEAVQQLKAEMANQKLNLITERRLFDEFLERQPTETIVSPGVLITINENGAQVAKLLPEEVRIKHRVFLLPPGVPMDLPKPVAEIIRDRRRLEKSTKARQEALAKNLELGELDKVMKKIDEESGTPMKWSPT